jgi:hypothetical protein
MPVLVGFEGARQNDEKQKEGRIKGRIHTLEIQTVRGKRWEKRHTRTLAPITSSAHGRRLASPLCATPKMVSNTAITASEEWPGTNSFKYWMYSSPRPVAGLIHATKSAPRTVTRRRVKMPQF